MYGKNILVVGNKNSGKTSIILRLLTNSFSEEYTPTDCETICKVYIKRYLIYSYNVWEHISTNKNQVLKTPNVGIVVCDNDDVKSYVSWIKYLKTFGDIPILIIFSKCDEKKYDLNKIKMGIKNQKIKNITSLLSVSSKNEEGLKELKEEIIRVSTLR